MKYKFEYRPYKRPFIEILQTPQGPWRHREGVIVRMENEDGVVGFGEIAPLPSFGSENLEEALAYCQIIGNEIENSAIQKIPENLPCCRFALESAIREMQKDDNSNPSHNLEAAALIARGFKCVKQVEALLQAGYRTFKWKIGIEPVKELTIYKQLTSILPEDAKLRIDANGALNEDTTKYWIKQFSGGPVEFLEQPLPRRQIQEMRKVAASYPDIPIALDETASSFSEVKRICEAGWNGPIIIKPALLGNLNDFLDWRKDCKQELIYSSVYETAIGMQALLRIAASHPTQPSPIGIGTLDYFNDDGLALHHNAARVNFWRFTAEDFDRIWRSL